ncbi:DNA mismatch repair protein MutL, partial [termite gut metagenome]
QINYDANFNPFKTSEPAYLRFGIVGKNLYEGLNHSFDDKEEIPNKNTFPTPSLYPNDLLGEKSALHWQFKGRFILTSVKSGLMLIDQHRAHIRILFDKYMKQIRCKQNFSQKVLFPETLPLSVSESVMLQSVMEDLTNLGFDLEDLGNACYAINAIPSGTEGLAPAQLIHNMIHIAMAEGNDVKEEIQSLLALTLARASAIVYGQVLSNEEMVNLVDTLFACQTPDYTPDRQTVLVTIKEEEIEKLLK